MEAFGVSNNSIMPIQLVALALVNTSMKVEVVGQDFILLATIDDRLEIVSFEVESSVKDGKTWLQRCLAKNVGYRCPQDKD